MPQPLHHAIILQAAAPAIAPPDLGFGGGLEQFGLWGLAGYLVLKEALGWFRTKEQAESDLVKTLISDSRKMQETLLSNLFSLHEQQHNDLSAVNEKLEAICDRLDKLV